MQLEQTQSWEEWKQTLAQAVQKGREAGMSQSDIVVKAEQIGDLLAQHIDPANPQQKVLQELWQAADQNEQKALASAIVKMVSNGQRH